MKTKIAMTEEQWATVIDAVNDKYPDSDCLDILINNPFRIIRILRRSL